jgi:hypothetical protein
MILRALLDQVADELAIFGERDHAASDADDEAIKMKNLDLYWHLSDRFFPAQSMQARPCAMQAGPPCDGGRRLIRDTREIQLPHATERGSNRLK